MLLSVKKRQEYLKELGFYNKGIDGKEGPATKKAYKDFQCRYLTKENRPKDRNGIYGTNTDTALRNAHILKDSEFLSMDEIICKCKKDCCGYPVVISENLVSYYNVARRHYGSPMKPTNVLRCKKHNKEVGGSSTSGHLKGTAADFKGDMTTTNAKRHEVVDYWTLELKQFHAYCNGYRRYNGKVTHPNTPSMGTAVHIQVKK